MTSRQHRRLLRLVHELARRPQDPHHLLRVSALITFVLVRINRPAK